MRQYAKTIVGVFLIVSSLLLSRETYAALSFSVTPYDGGTDLRFSKVSSADISRVDKQVNIRITATDNKQYSLYQTMLDPLTNEKGEKLPLDSFVFNALSGKNQYGAVHVLQEQPVAISKAIIYTSNTAGLSDNLVLSYGIKLDANVMPGSYSGRMAFTLEPIDSTTAVPPQILNVYVQIESTAIVSVTTATGSSFITLNSIKENAQSADILVDVKSNIGSSYNIYHLVTSTLVSEKGLQLPVGAITFSVSGGDKGKKDTTPTNLSLNRQLLYTSNQKGDKDSFAVTYKIGDLSKAKAGKYKGTLQYIFASEGAGENSIVGTFVIELENEELFNIGVTLGPTGRISFDDLKPGDKPQKYEVFIDVKTNAGEPYQVIQTASSELVNKAGEKIPAKYFTLKTESLDEKELPGLRFATASEVTTKDTVLYVSDKNGSAVSFKVIYELSVPDTVKAEEYHTNIVYSLLKIQ